MVVVALGAHEGTELAVDVADVRVVDVAVDDVGDDFVAATVVSRTLRWRRRVLASSPSSVSGAK
jgi:hypothetical protein